MATHTRDYKGKTVSIKATEDQKRWYWAYTIDAGETHNLNDRGLPDEETAVSDAERDAQRVIDAGGK